MSTAPPPYWSGTLQKQIVFAKFHRAHHQIDFDVTAQKATVHSIIHFTIRESGCPVIDLQLADHAGLFVELNGSRVGYPEIDSPNLPSGRPATRYRIVNPGKGVVSPGSHQVHLLYELREQQVEGLTLIRGRRFDENGVECFFGMSDRRPDPDDDHADGGDRFFLERFLPSNLEFDQHPIHIDVSISGTQEPHAVVANGAVTQPVSTSHWRIDYPAHYSSACPFLLLVRSQRLCDREDFYPSRSGSRTPVRVFGLDLPQHTRDAILADYWKAAERELSSLELLLGPFPHPRLLLYFWPPGGLAMEYASAATVADSHDYGNLRHELIHSWVGRGVMPADGDAGWFDEGVATLIEEEMAGINVVGPAPLFCAAIGAMSPYRRYTDDRAWYHREVYRVMYYLRGMLPGASHRWCSFVRHLASLRMHESLSTAAIQFELERYAGRSFQDEFDRYIYGR